MTARVFAVLSAVFLVVSVGIASLLPLGLPLGQGIQMVDRGGLDWVRGHSTDWIWTWVELPFLLRPLWLLPACLGVICAGIAVTFNLGKASPSRRRRS